MAALYSTLTEIAMIRISSSSGTILLPATSSIVGRQVSFKDYLGTLTSNSTITFSTQVGDSFEDGTTTKTFSNAYAFGTFYTGSTTKWNIIGGTTVTTMAISSLQANALQVNSLTIGTGTGWIGFNPIQTLALSTIQMNTSTTYTNTAFVGGISTLNALQFYGLTGTYSNTVLAEQSTGTGIQEFLMFRGSSASDRIRMQTTGSIVFEPGVTARTFSGAAALATPTMTMMSNLVGIGTSGTPGAMLDVGGTGRFQLTSTLNIQTGQLNGSAVPNTRVISLSSLTGTTADLTGPAAYGINYYITNSAFSTIQIPGTAQTQGWFVTLKNNTAGYLAVNISTGYATYPASPITIPPASAYTLAFDSNASAYVAI